MLGDVRRPGRHRLRKRVFAAERPSQRVSHRGGPCGHRAWGTASRAHAMVSPNAHPLHLSAAAKRALTQVTSFPVPSVSCVPLGPGCDSISTSAGGATGVKGLNAVDSASHTDQHPQGHRAPRPGPVRRQRIRRRDQQHRRDPGLQHRLAAQSSPISLDTMMGLTGRG